MTKKEREQLRAMSSDAFGNPRMAEKLISKGEWKTEVAYTASGKQVSVKRLQHLSHETVVSRMQEIIDKRSNKTEPVAEAVTGQEGGTNGETKQESQATQQDAGTQA